MSLILCIIGLVVATIAGAVWGVFWIIAILIAVLSGALFRLLGLIAAIPAAGMSLVARGFLPSLSAVSILLFALAAILPVSLAWGAIGRFLEGDAWQHAAVQAY